MSNARPSWQWAVVALGAAALAGTLAACTAAGEHDEGGITGEESGTQYGRDETYDETRADARLVLNYDPETNSFVGTVENTTEATLTAVRVEVHLSNGVELGPTVPTNLGPGEMVDIGLAATEAPFDTYSAHPEVGSGSGESGEHAGESGEHSGESEEGGEHGG